LIALIRRQIADLRKYTICLWTDDGLEGILQAQAIRQLNATFASYLKAGIAVRDLYQATRYC